MPELSPAPSISDTRSQALMVLIERLAALDLTPLLVYRIESVTDAALPFLAWQFDVLSPLWQLVAPSAVSIDALTGIDSLTDIDTLTAADSADAGSDTAAQRALLELAIPLHRMRGTPAAIKRALGALGWASATIAEGQDAWGGAAYPSNEGWAVFRVMVNLAAGQSVAAGAVETILAAVNFFKPARAWLDSIWFVAPPISDGAPAPSDRFTLTGIAQSQIDSAPFPGDGALTIAMDPAPLADAVGPIAPLYNAHYRHSGITYGANEPVVADPALILNGTAVLYGG
jgi:P2-related tail formation protein